MSQMNPKIKFYVTDVCNEQCVYCPIHTERAQRKSPSLLSASAIGKIIREAISLGYTSVKFSGEYGEPLLRKDLEEMVKYAKKFGAKEISIATNGVLLKDRLQALLEAGANKFCISLDTINPKLYKKITGVDQCESVKESILLAAKALGTRVKVNMVVMKNINDSEIAKMREWVKDSGATLQLIEVFPVEGRKDQFKEQKISLENVLNELRRDAVYSSFYKPRKMEHFVLSDESHVEVTAIRRAPGSNFGASRLLVHPNGDLANYDVSSTGLSLGGDEDAQTIRNTLEMVSRISVSDIGKPNIKSWAQSPCVS